MLSNMEPAYMRYISIDLIFFCLQFLFHSYVAFCGENVSTRTLAIKKVKVRSTVSKRKLRNKSQKQVPSDVRLCNLPLQSFQSKCSTFPRRCLLHLFHLLHLHLTGFSRSHSKETKRNSLPKMVQNTKMTQSI